MKWLSLAASPSSNGHHEATAAFLRIASLMHFEEGTAEDRRTITINAAPALAARLDRLAALRAFVDAAGWGEP